MKMSRYIIQLNALCTTINQYGKKINKYLNYCNTTHEHERCDCFISYELLRPCSDYNCWNNRANCVGNNFINKM